MPETPAELAAQVERRFSDWTNQLPSDDWQVILKEPGGLQEVLRVAFYAGYVLATIDSQELKEISNG